MPYLAETLVQKIPCPCGNWEWRETLAVAAVGYFAIQRRCERCRHWYLLIFRVGIGAVVSARHLHTVPFHQRNEQSLQTALRALPEFKDDGDTVTFLVTTARLLADQRAKGAAA